jgi:Outer membrane protein beta-barrel domain
MCGMRDTGGSSQRRDDERAGWRYHSRMRTLAGLGAAVLLLSLAAPGELSAQGSRTAVGAYVGYSRTDLAGADAREVEARQGALTGVYLHFPLSPIVAIRPELTFALKGGRTTTAEGAVFDTELAYLEFPVLVKVAFPTGRFRPVLFGGPAPALRIGCDFLLFTPQGQGDPVLEERVTCGRDEVAIVRQLDLGLVVGGGIEGLWPSAALSLEARVTSGIRSVFDGVEVRNRAFGVVLGLTF